ncbi:MAG: DUF2252 family protein [Bdellovibrio sp.]|nr:DUF2252 family protein [Bdellovibrio sp.]
MRSEDLNFPTSTIPLQTFKESYSHLDEAAFAKKLSQALQAGPVMFFRSFVNAYYGDITTQLESKDLTLCFGDPHPENFGFLEFPSGPRFVFNDLDDSGYCPLRADVLRYFVAVALTYDDSDLLEDLVSEYIQVLNDQKKAASLDKNLFPNLEKKRNKLLKKLTQGNEFLESQELLKIPASLKRKMLSDFKSEPVFSGVSFLDVAEVIHSGGGSGGLKRYLVLIENLHGKELIELKELTEPGTHFGLWSHPKWSYADRIAELKEEFWHESPQFYAYTFYQNHFLIRSRTRDSVALEKLSSGELKDYLRVQVGILATHHKIYKKWNIPGLEKWLQKNIPILQTRYLETYRNLKRP